MPDIHGKERRTQRRLEVAEPLRARAGSTPILIYDVSSRGLRILHAAHIARVGETLIVVIDWHGNIIQLNCAVRRTEMKLTTDEQPHNVFESGLQITFADEPSNAAWETLIEGESRKAMVKRSVSIAMPPW